MRNGEVAVEDVEVVEVDELIEEEECFENTLALLAKPRTILMRAPQFDANEDN